LIGDPVKETESSDKESESVEEFAEETWVEESSSEEVEEETEIGRLDGQDAKVIKLASS